MGSVSKRLVVFAGLLAAPVATTTVAPHLPSPARSTVDPRLVRLKTFLTTTNCPIHRYAEEFIRVADDQALDWRLLPSIAFVESSGGKTARHNNIFGWDCSKGKFASIPAGIRYVADKLANSGVYREKSVDQKLRLYNPQLGYRARVRSVMAAISATELLAEAN